MAHDRDRATELAARALAALPTGWTVLDDRVAVGPTGVFVVAANRGAGEAAADDLARGARIDRRIVHALVCDATQDPEALAADLLGRRTVLTGAGLSSTRVEVTSAVRRGRRDPVLGRASRGRSHRSGSLGRLGVLLLLVGATLGLAPYAAARLERRLEPPPPAPPLLGETVRIAGTTSRPPADLTPEEVDGPSDRYVVRLTVANAGEEPLTLGGVTAWLVLDDLARAQVRRGPGDGLAGVALQPGSERTVTYRFAVPEGRTPIGLAASVGDQAADGARWRTG